MSVNTVQAGPTIGYNGGDRLPSNVIWHNCPWQSLLSDPAYGYAFWDDFLTFPGFTSTSGAAVQGAIGQWAFYAYQGGTCVDAAIQGGGITFGSDGDNEGFAFHSITGGIRIEAAQKKCWWEARWKVSTISDTKTDCFVGLMEGLNPGTAVPITTTDDTLADKNLLGWQRLSSDGDQLDFKYKADGQAIQVLATDQVSATVNNTSAAGLIADTFIKTGFSYDPDRPAAQRGILYLNGVPSTTYLTATQIAAATFGNDMYLSPVFAIMNATGTTPGTMTIDWIRAAQLY